VDVYDHNDMEYLLIDVIYTTISTYPFSTLHTSTTWIYTTMMTLNIYMIDFDILLFILGYLLIHFRHVFTYILLRRQADEFTGCISAGDP
jgi:hypothetical protein